MGQDAACIEHWDSGSWGFVFLPPHNSGCAPGPVTGPSKPLPPHAQWRESLIYSPHAVILGSNKKNHTETSLVVQWYDFTFQCSVWVPLLVRELRSGVAWPKKKSLQWLIMPITWTLVHYWWKCKLTKTYWKVLWQHLIILETCIFFLKHVSFIFKIKKKNSTFLGVHPTKKKKIA